MEDGPFSNQITQLTPVLPCLGVFSWFPVDVIRVQWVIECECHQRSQSYCGCEELVGARRWHAGQYSETGEGRRKWNMLGQSGGRRGDGVSVLSRLLIYGYQKHQNQGTNSPGLNQGPEPPATQHWSFSIRSLTVLLCLLRWGKLWGRLKFLLSLFTNKANLDRKG